MKMSEKLRLSKPRFIEFSKVPVLLSKISPIDIGAITLGPFVFSRVSIPEKTRNHETIHWQQYIETGIIGFLLLYALFWLIGFIKYKDGEKAYYQIPFEQEAYENDDNKYYLVGRRRWCWRKYKI